MTLRLAMLAAGMTLTTAACGNDAGLTTEQADSVEAFVAADLDDDEITCVAEGLDELAVPIEALATSDLPPDEDVRVLAVTLSCIEDLSTIPSLLEAFVSGAADEGVALTDEQARCAIDAAAEADTAAAIAACLDDDTTIAGATSDDPLLALLRERCDAGNNQACDELYLTADIGSDHEAFARTCGGRRDEGTGGTCFDDLG